MADNTVRCTVFAEIHIQIRDPGDRFCKVSLQVIQISCLGQCGDLIQLVAHIVPRLPGFFNGGFQALMPLLGYLLGVRFEVMVANVDHWIAFVLLGLIGANMVRESGAGEEKLDDSFTVSTMLLLAVATSIDALAIGVTFAFLGVNIVEAIILIGITTGIISGVGLKIGNVFGSRYKSKAEMAGGIVLILMGIKILVQHLLGLG